jgi:hypothetical protein
MPKKAIDLFNQIATPDEFTITFLFNACAQLGTTDALNLTKKISKEMPKSFYLDHFLLTSLLDVLVKCGDVTMLKLYLTIQKRNHCQCMVQ